MTISTPLTASSSSLQAAATPPLSTPTSRSWRDLLSRVWNVIRTIFTQCLNTLVAALAPIWQQVVVNVVTAFYSSLACSQSMFKRSDKPENIELATAAV